MISWGTMFSRVLLTSRLLLRNGSARSGRCARAVKPYADILLPLSLVFFAYKADEVSRQQADILRLQTEIQKTQAQPVFSVEFYDDGPSTGHEHAEIRVVNHGGPVFDLSMYPTSAINLQADPQPNGIPYSGMVFPEDYGWSEFYKLQFPVNISNFHEKSQSTRVFPVKWELQKIDKLIELIGGVKIEGFKLSGYPVIVLNMKWRNYAGTLGERKYLIKWSSITNVDKSPKGDEIKGDVDGLRTAFDKIIKDRRYDFGGD